MDEQSEESRAITTKARRLILAATGDEYGDGYVVTDVAIGYAEPGYGSDDAVVIFGDWNDRQPYEARRAGLPITKEQAIPGRLAAALERIGAEPVWYDEWTRCGGCYRAMRTKSDSYSWRMYGAWSEDGCDYYCADCLTEDAESTVTEYVNEPTRCITFPIDLAALGFVQWEPDDPQRYENGWYDGQDADPRAILDAIEAEHDVPVQVVLVLDEQSQFFVAFSAHVRPQPSDD